MHIRSATPQDAEAIAAIFAPVVRDTVISFEWEPPTAEVLRARIEKTLARYPWLVAQDAPGGVAVYGSDVCLRDAPCSLRSVIRSFYRQERARGQGLGRRLYEALHRQLVDLGYFRCYAGISLPHPASVALHEALGYRPIGVYEKVGFKHGAWRDVGWWCKALQPLVDNPPPPRRPPPG
jgi:phosphinothricin acetyltransferase